MIGNLPNTFAASRSRRGRDAATNSTGAKEARRLGRRGLRFGLGALWLLDGLLQLQPRMWSEMATGVMQPAIAGQPAPLHVLLTWASNLVNTHVFVANAMVALIQIALGIALLFDLAPRLAILASLAWTLAVWLIGEGAGGLFTGSALFLTGAPGAVLLYGLLGAAAWPRSLGERSAPVAGWLRYALAALWTLAAVLQLQPVYLTSNGLAHALAANLDGQPGGLHASLYWAVSVTGGHGVMITLALAALQFALAAGVLFARHPRPWLVASILWCLCAWWFGQAFGMLFTGLGTDPNVAPLAALLIVAIWPYSSPKADLDRPHTRRAEQSGRFASQSQLTGLGTTGF